jgi:hypothetical protein
MWPLPAAAAPRCLYQQRGWAQPAGPAESTLSRQAAFCSGLLRCVPCRGVCRVYTFERVWCQLSWSLAVGCPAAWSGLARQRACGVCTGRGVALARPRCALEAAAAVGNTGRVYIVCLSLPVARDMPLAVERGCALACCARRILCRAPLSRARVLLHGVLLLGGRGVGRLAMAAAAGWCGGGQAAPRAPLSPHTTTCLKALPKLGVLGWLSACLSAVGVCKSRCRSRGGSGCLCACVRACVRACLPARAGLLGAQRAPARPPQTALSSTTNACLCATPPFCMRLLCCAC